MTTDTLKRLMTAAQGLEERIDSDKPTMAGIIIHEKAMGLVLDTEAIDKICEDLKKLTISESNFENSDNINRLFAHIMLCEKILKENETGKGDH